MVSALCEQHRAWDPARYGFLPDILARYANWLPQRAADPRSAFFVAESSARPVGFIVATLEREIPIYAVTEYAFIHDTWVEPAHRRRGIARALTLAALDRFRALGVTQVRLDTAHANESARRLFASCGFRASTIQMLAELPPIP